MQTPYFLDESVVFSIDCDPCRQFDSTGTKNTTVIPDPTPIGPSGVEKVSTLPIHNTPLASDPSQINALHQLFSPFMLSNHQLIGSSGIRELPERQQSSSPPKVRVGGCGAATPQAQCGRQQTAKWNKRYGELVQFQKEHGHCLVPVHNYQNVLLANWVKRQRNQYQRKAIGLHSTLCNKRQRALEDLGFVWDAHTACWDERYEELRQFWKDKGHSRVPKNYKANPSLAMWVKCQRRQYKVLKGKRLTCVHAQRIRLLKDLHFEFNPRA
ncbi:unnamed protein product [Cylindrotheca closterium]|uniref:Helicase-associated domain-containing protein n=1 Tax=Cylindrotheca closterium TaxID=2856 RepID=A0AAD2CFH0_9STRA|nr:unnamed protein product [Cylindrotheca closterium]